MKKKGVKVERTHPSLFSLNPFFHSYGGGSGNGHFDGQLISQFNGIQHQVNARKKEHEATSKKNLHFVLTS